MFEHHAVCYRCGKKEAVFLTKLPPDPPLGWIALHTTSPYTGGQTFDVKGLPASRHVHLFCSWQCLAKHVALPAGHEALQKAQSPPESDASTPAGRQGPESGPDATAALELPRPDAPGLSYIRIRHAAGCTDVAIHNLLDVIENLEARVKALESNLTK